MRRILFCFLVLLFCSSLFAEDRVYIDVGEASIKRSLLAMPFFQYYGTQSEAHIKNGVDLYKIIQNDLDVSSYFTFIDPKAYLEDTDKVGLKPAPGSPNGFSFSKWGADTLKTDFLIRAGYKINNGQFELEAYVYYVPQAKLVFGKLYKAALNSVDIRKLAHTFADDVVYNLTGKKGFFNTRIVVSSDRSGRKTKEIFTMDWDSFNIQQKSFHKSISISPAWSNDGTKIAYTSFEWHPGMRSRNTDVFLYEINTGKRWLVSAKRGINSGANFLANDNEILLTISSRGNPDIYRLNIDTQASKPLTNGPNGAMNVEPAISPDGTKIAFASNRPGKIMIYTMNADGSDVKRLTFAGQYNATPAWSPDGKKIAFAGQDKDHFDIFIMNADGTSMERLTSAKKANGRWSNNESPSFSPDGRQVLFTSDRTGTYQIHIVNVDGTNERRLTNDKYNYYQPKWSK